MASNRFLAPILFGAAANGPSITWGTGSPESSITANVGSIYLRDDGGSGTSVYFKETGDGTNTGWVAINPTGGTSGFSGYSGYSGQSGFSGYRGQWGGAITINYIFNSDTSSLSINSGELGLNNATQNLSTTITVSNTDALGVSWSSVLATIADSTNPVRGHIRLSKLYDPASWLVFTVSSVTSIAGGKKTIAVTVVSSSAASPFALNDSLLLEFNRSGDSGFSGYSGYSGLSGYSGYSGFSGYSGYSGFSGFSGYSGYSGSGGTPGGSNTQVQFNDSSVFGGDADFTWDKTNNILNVAQSTATTKGSISVNPPTTRPAILITGGSADTSTDATGGVALYMTHNGAGNRQFVIGASDNYNLSNASVFRYLTGSGIATVDGITGNGGTRCPINLGTDSSSIAIGNTSLAYNATLPAKVSVYAEASGVGLQVNLGSSGTADLARFANNAGTALSVVSSAGKIGAVQTSPTAYLHLGAGTSSANTAPLKFTSGTSMTTAEAGAVEFDGDRLLITPSVAIRQALVGCIFTQTQTVTVTGNLGETTVIGTGTGTTTLPANFFKTGKTIRFIIRGYMTVAGNPVTLNPKIKLGSTVVDANSSSPSLAGTVTNQAFLWSSDATFYATGTTNNCWSQGYFLYGSSDTNQKGFGRENTSILSIDTTTSLAIDVTFTWGGAGASSSDTITVTNLTIEILN